MHNVDAVHAACSRRASARVLPLPSALLTASTRTQQPIELRCPTSIVQVNLFLVAQLFRLPISIRQQVPSSIRGTQLPERRSNFDQAVPVAALRITSKTRGRLSLSSSKTQSRRKARHRQLRLDCVSRHVAGDESRRGSMSHSQTFPEGPNPFANISAQHSAHGQTLERHRCGDKGTIHANGLTED